MHKKSRLIGLIIFLAVLSIISFNFAPVLLAAEAGSSAFSDLSSANPDLAYVNYLAGKGIITGYPDGTFKPQESLTRAQAAVVLVKAGNITVDPNAASPFKDLPANHWARPYVAAAVKAGYISGFPDGTFQPDQKLSRSQGISLILKLSKQPLNATLPNLSDINSSHWAAQAAAVGLASGMVGLSSEGEFLPDAAFSRINMAHALGILFCKDPGLYASSLPGKIKAVQGKTTIIRAGSQTEEILQGAGMVNVGDTIITDKGANAELDYPDGSSMLIKESSEIKVKEARGRKYIKTNGQEGIAVDWLNLDLKKGTMFTALATKHENTEASSPGTKTTSSRNKTIASLNGIEYIADTAQGNNQEMPWYETSKTKKVKVKVDMPWGVASVRGTFVVFSVSPSGQVSVSCLNGNADVSNVGQTVALGQNQSTVVTASTAAPQATTAMSPEAKQLFAQVVTWIEETARIMDENQEQTAPAPPAALISQLQEVLTPGQQNVNQNQTTKTGNSAMTALQAINQALGSIGISSGNSIAFQTTNQSSSSSGSSTVTILSVEDITASVTQGDSYQLPANATVSMSNGTKVQMPVTWSSGNPDTSTARTVTITGILTGLTNQVKLILTIERKLGVAAPVESGAPMVFSGGIKIDLGSMTVPAGATVKVDKTVPTNLEKSGLQTGGQVLSIKFENMNISQPVEISLPVSSGVDASKAGIYFYNEDTKKWEYQPCTLVDGVLKATVKHFSIYGVLLDLEAPTNPSIKQGTKGSDSVELILDATDNSVVANYQIYRNDQLIATTDKTTYTDHDLAPGNYSYRLKAVDPFGNTSEFSSSLDVNIKGTNKPDNPDTPNTAPGTPKITMTPSSGSVTINDLVTITASSSDAEGDALTYVWAGRIAETSKYTEGKHVISVKAVDEHGLESESAVLVFYVLNETGGSKTGGLTLTGPESRIYENGIDGGNITKYTFIVPPVSGHSGQDFGRVRGLNVKTQKWDELSYGETKNGITLSKTIDAGLLYSRLEFYYYTNHTCMYGKSEISYTAEFAFGNIGADVPAEAAPVAGNVKIEDLQTGILAGTYNFSDSNGDPEGKSAYQWYWDDNQAGSNKKVITNANGLTYTVDPAYINKYLFFEVVPKAASGVKDTTDGLPVLSPGIQVAKTLNAAGQLATGVVKDLALAVNNGKPRVAYKKNNNVIGAQKYSSAAEWINLGDSPAINGAGLSIAANGSDNTYVSFGNIDTNSVATLVYATEGWKQLPLISTGLVKDISLVYGSSSLIAVGTNSSVNVYVYGSTSWEAVGSAISGAGYMVELPKDPGNPDAKYISYSTGSGIFFGSFDDDSWKIDNIYSGSTREVSSCVAAGKRYVAFIDNNSQITVKEYNGTEWVALGSPFKGSSCQLGIIGSVPILAYIDENGVVCIKSYLGGQWIGGQIHQKGSVSDSCLVLAIEGVNPYIAFADGSRGGEITVMTVTP